MGVCLVLASCGGGGAKPAASTPTTPATPPVSTPTPPADAIYPVFRKPGNIWTTRLPANAPIAADSADIVARLVRQSKYGDAVGGQPPLAYYTGEWHHFVGTDWQRIWPNIPANTPLKRVLWIKEDGQPADPKSEGKNFPLQSWIDAVPVPELPIDQLRSQGGGDKPLVLYQKSSDTVWEFWKFDDARIARGSDGRNYYTAPDGSVVPADYTARYAGRILKASTDSNGVYPLTTGSSATSMAYVNGFIMVRDALAGRIEHAMALTLPVTGNVAGATWCSSKDMYVAPATRCDTSSMLKNGLDLRATDGIREGTLFRLPASFDPDAYVTGTDDRSRFLRMVLVAMRDYGVYVTDTSPTMTLNAEGAQVIRLGTPYHDIPASQVPAWWGAAGIFSSKNNITFDIPWGQLQVVQPHDWRNW